MIEIAENCETVETVRGPVPLNKLDITLTHEHIFCNFTGCFKRAPYKHELMHDHRQIALKGSGYLNLYPYSNLCNLKLFEDTLEKNYPEFGEFFKELGGNTIMENSTVGLRFLNQWHQYEKMSILKKINIIIGTGFYTAQSQYTSILNISKEEMYNVMRMELQEGILYRKKFKMSRIKAGFIGEVGSSWPIRDFEKRSISATGEVQEQLHCSVSLSPGSSVFAPMEVMRIYQEAGGNARKAIMCHVDRTLTKEEQLMEFADDNKCYIQFSMFGTECSFYQLDPTAIILSDTERVEFISKFKQEGKLDRVLMSHDIHTKNRQKEHGGHGYGHILKTIAPYMTENGFSHLDFELLMVENPMNMLSRF